MKVTSILFATTGLTSLVVASTALNDTGTPVIDLGYAKYVGYTNTTTGINYYRGLHYAQAPTGSLRWQKPVPIESSPNMTGQTINATVIGPACLQGSPAWIYLSEGETYTPATSLNGQSEDCLLLDVLVPSEPQSIEGGLPVVVQIHGGGYNGGSAQTYPGDAMVHASDGGIIYVAIQYRLSIAGFLGGSEIQENGFRNVGLYDQRLSLGWVQRHIAAFGGDPNKVTIWGGSAGGGSVTYQLMAGGGLGGPPFRAAIAEYPWWQPLLNDSTQELQYRYALNASGCDDLNCLRGLSSLELLNAGSADLADSYPGPGNGYGLFWFGPVVDGEFLQELPDVAFKTGNYYKVPLLVDRDGYEGVDFSNASQTTQIEETLEARNIFPSAGLGFFSRLYQLYPRSNYNSTFWQRQSWFGDFIIDCPTYQMATSAIDELANSSAVFKLVFDAGSQLHSATLPFLATTDINWSSANNHTLAEILTSYWISFISTLDPNPLRTANAPFWPSYAAGGAGTTAEGESVGFSTLDITYTDISVQDDPDSSVQCEFFLNRGYTLRN